jgi:hypothetical protein
MARGAGQTCVTQATPRAAPFSPGTDPRGKPLLDAGAPEQWITVCTKGGCHYLALALHRRYGWPLRVLGTPADEYSLRRWDDTVGSDVRHVYCLNDQGRPVDVHGVFADEEAIRRFCAHQHDLDEQLVSSDADIVSITERLPREFDFLSVDEEMLALGDQVADGLQLDKLSTGLR